MADSGSEDGKLKSPPRKISRHCKRPGRLFQIHLGYGEKGKRLWEEYDAVKRLLGFDSFAETTEWILSMTRPFACCIQTAKKTKKQEGKKRPKTQLLYGETVAQGGGEPSRFVVILFVICRYRIDRPHQYHALLSAV